MEKKTDVQRWAFLGSVGIVSGVRRVSGTAQVGQLLTGSYTYTDTENDPQGASTFRWLRGTTPITGATAQTYTLVAADETTLVSFEVTPVAQAGTSPGLAIVSAAVGPIAAEPFVGELFNQIKFGLAL